MTDAQRRAARELAHSAYYTRCYLESLQGTALRYADTLSIDPQVIRQLENSLSTVRILEDSLTTTLPSRYNQTIR